MENASKALLIAGAILLAILLITIGITVYRTATNSMGDVGSKMNATQIQEFNQPFLSAETKSASYPTCRNVVELVLRTSGASNNEFGATIDIQVGGTKKTGTAVDDFCGTSKPIEPGKIYEISVGKTPSGLVSSVNFTAK